MCIQPLVCYSRTKAVTLLLIKTPVQGHRLEAQTGGEDGNKCIKDGVKGETKNTRKKKNAI